MSDEFDPTTAAREAALVTYKDPKASDAARRQAREYLLRPAPDLDVLSEGAFEELDHLQSIVVGRGPTNVSDPAGDRRRLEARRRYLRQALADVERQLAE